MSSNPGLKPWAMIRRPSGAGRSLPGQSLRVCPVKSAEPWEWGPAPECRAEVPVPVFRAERNGDWLRSEAEVPVPVFRAERTGTGSAAKRRCLSPFSGRSERGLAPQRSGGACPRFQGGSERGLAPQRSGGACPRFQGGAGVGRGTGTARRLAEPVPVPTSTKPSGTDSESRSAAERPGRHSHGGPWERVPVGFGGWGPSSTPVRRPPPRGLEVRDLSHPVGTEIAGPRIGALPPGRGTWAVRATRYAAPPDHV